MLRGLVNDPVYHALSEYEQARYEEWYRKTMAGHMDVLYEEAAPIRESFRAAAEDFARVVEWIVSRISRNRK